MAYDPKAVTEDQRAYAYKYMWVGLPSSIALLIVMQFGALEVLTPLLGGLTSGTFIGLAFAGSHDEFVKDQIAYAANLTLAFAGLVLFAQIIPFAREYEPDAGLILAIMAVIFNTALAYQRWNARDAFGESA